jgi:oligopeptide transport system substrate-binding protein
MKVRRITALLLLLVLAFTVMGGAALAQDGAKVLVTGRQMGPSDIPTIDPSLAEDVPSVQVIVELFPELVRVHEETAEVQPGMATWEVSEDGTVYTFSIVPEVPWVRYNPDSGEVEQVMDENGNPRYVTAQDFAYGIQRSLDPLTASPYQYVLLPWIVGGEEFGLAAEATEEERATLIENLGIEVVDDYTLQITTPEASVVTPFIFGMWITVAEPSWAIDEFADFWIDPGNINTYGPFTLQEWVRGDGGSLTMIKNPFWPGTDSIPQPQLDSVQFRFLDDSPQLAEFEAGTMHVAEVPEAEIDRVMADPALSQALFVGPGTCTYYYGFNVELPPFDDARVRRAFSMAIDRQAIVDNVTRSGETPANIFTLPSLNAAPTTEMYPDIGVYSDPEAAAALWQEYLDETGQSASDFQPTLFHNESALHASIAQAVQAQWLETLGVEVQISVADFATYLDTRGNYEVFRAGWCFDYPDTHNFMYDVGWHSDLLEENDTHWSNADYDALIDQAFVAPTVEERRDLYAQAEQILVNEEAAIAPIYFYVTKDLTAPNVERTHSLITREYYEKWDLTG